MPLNGVTGLFRCPPNFFPCMNWERITAIARLAAVIFSSSIFLFANAKLFGLGMAAGIVWQDKVPGAIDNVLTVVKGWQGLLIAAGWTILFPTSAFITTITLFGANAGHHLHKWRKG